MKQTFNEPSGSAVRTEDGEDTANLLEHEQLPASGWPLHECPNASRLLECHARLLNGEPTAADELAEVLLPWLFRRLSRKFCHTDGELICDAATAALIGYLRKPDTFKATLGGRLDLFLERQARHHLANLLRGEMRRKRLEQDYAREFLKNSVELCPSAEHLTVRAWLYTQEKLDELLRAVADPLDRAMLELWGQGEWHTTAFAKVRGMDSLPPGEQRQAVKRAKDRITKMLRRTWAKLTAIETAEPRTCPNNLTAGRSLDQPVRLTGIQ